MSILKMNKNFLLVFFLIFINNFTGFCQMSVSGYIMDETYNPVNKAKIIIDEAEQSSIIYSDSTGYFYIDKINADKIIVTISALGYYTQNQTLDLNRVQSLDVILKSDLKHKNNDSKYTELSSINVTGKNESYINNYSSSATRLSMLAREVPQSINSINHNIIEDRQTFQLADAVKIVPGVESSSFYNQYTIRGISQNEEGQIINGMRTRQYYFLQPLTTNIEKIEVIKGPASATFASVDPGGSINLITKKPLVTSSKTITLNTGSYNTIRGALDFTGPLNENKTLLYRLNAAFQKARSYRDLVHNDALLLSPSFTYKLNNKTKVNIETIYTNQTGNLDRGQPIFGAVSGITNLKSTPISLNLGKEGDYYKSENLILMGTFTHAFNKQISMNAAYMKQTWKEDLQEHRTTNAFAVDVNNNPVNSLVGMQYVKRKQNWSVDNFNAYISYNFKTGPISHDLITGFDFSAWKKIKGGNQSAARGYILKDGSVTSRYDPTKAEQYETVTINNVTLPKPNVNYFDLINLNHTSSESNYIMNSQITIPPTLSINQAIYIQEQLRWKRVIVIAGIRQDWFEDKTNYDEKNEKSFKNNKLLPRLGITLILSDNINIYSTYLEGYQPQSNTASLLPSTGNYNWSTESAARFKPLISDLKEAGIKTNFFNNKLVANLSVYEINQKNLLMNANLAQYPDSLITRGAERSKGLELEISLNIAAYWHLYASYSYNDARITKDNNPDLIGARKQNSPYNSASFWTRYNFQNIDIIKDWGIGAGFQYNSNRIPWFDRTFKVPSYFLVDLALYYAPKNTNMQFTFNVNNVMNKTYWIGAQNYLRLFPGAPRNALATATIKF
ncbi:TonB-dependent siderophore receptor [Apibacter sp. HY039]|uniref:TonB-dependent siderophore receptor n=1 Tax=Apibacter sp. HY039 TaxID=2501476 RepID=UPI002104E99F|nr:TonB-dependent siderophore receptor [Apibacter sp. HY039]